MGVGSKPSGRVSECSEKNRVGISLQTCLEVPLKVIDDSCVDLLALPDDHPVLLEVGHVHGATLDQHVAMLADHQPAHVREEEASLCVVRVGVGVRELVVHTMVAHPLVDVVLEGDRLEEG